MTLRHLKIFVAVCTYGSVTKASLALHIAQPSVSLAIHELEDYYQVPLFDRISRKLYLTQDGEHFLTYANQITSLFDELESTIHEWQDQEQLHIGSSITIANSLLCDCLAYYQTRYPKRKIQVTIQNSSRLEQMILQNNIDIALIEGVPQDHRLQKEQFFKDELVVLCANNNSLLKKSHVRFKDIVTQPFLLREKGSGTRDILDSIMQVHHIYLHPIWESASTQALVKGVIQNFGISILPYQMVKKELQQGILSKLSIADIRFERDYYMILHKHKYQNSAMKDFMHACIHVCSNI